MDANNSQTMEQAIAEFLLKHGRPLSKDRTSMVLVSAEIKIHAGAEKLQFSAFHSSHGRSAWADTIEAAVKECASWMPDNVVNTRLIEARKEVARLEALVREGRAF